MNRGCSYSTLILNEPSLNVKVQIESKLMMLVLDYSDPQVNLKNELLIS